VSTEPFCEASKTLLLQLIFNLIVFENGKDVINISSYWESVIRGAFLLVVVLLQVRLVRPGRISMVQALAGVAKRDGVRMLYFTAQPQIPPAEQADRMVTITAQTMPTTGTPARCCRWAAHMRSPVRARRRHHERRTPPPVGVGDATTVAPHQPGMGTKPRFRQSKSARSHDDGS
jgi:hypothetical protein